MLKLHPRAAPPVGHAGEIEVYDRLGQGRGPRPEVTDLIRHQVI
jgi:hypothetical protein